MCVCIHLQAISIFGSFISIFPRTIKYTRRASSIWRFIGHKYHWTEMNTLSVIYVYIGVFACSFLVERRNGNECRVIIYGRSQITTNGGEKESKRACVYIYTCTAIYTERWKTKRKEKRINCVCSIYIILCVYVYTGENRVRSTSVWVMIVSCAYTRLLIVGDIASIWIISIFHFLKLKREIILL